MIGVWPAERRTGAAGSLACIAASYYCCSLGRYLAASTAEMIFDGINHLASSPLEAALLAVLVAWLVSWALGGHSRAAQVASALQLSRLLGAVLLQSARQHSKAPGSPAQRRRLAPASPGKDIASFRLPDHSLQARKAAGKAAGKVDSAAPSCAASPPSAAPQQQKLQRQKHRRQQQQRWSMDAATPAGSGAARRQQVRALPKPRTSVDFDAAPASPPPKGSAQASAQQAQGQHCRALRTLADHRATPRLDGASPPAAEQPTQEQQQRWQPRMQRIASGQELAELAAGRHGSGTGSSRASSDGNAPAPAGAHLSPAAAVSASTAAAAGPAALSSWLPGLYLPAWPPLPFSAGSAAGHAVDAPATPPASPRDTAAAALDTVSRWAASTAAAAAWTGSTLDAALRPLIPGGSLPSAASLLWRAPSTPQPEALEGDALHHTASAPCMHAEDAAAAPQPRRAASTGADRRRHSVDGASARHYTHGGITADPNRRQALENLAAAARLQACSSRGRAAAPGHAALSRCGGAGSAPLGADAGGSALASVGLDGDTPQEIRDHVTDEHLLQFAAAVGEEAAVAAAAKLALPPAWADASCLLGCAAAGAAACCEAAWEQVVACAEGGLAYEVWRQPLRGGLYMYRSRAVFEGVSPRDLRPFHLDDHARDLWDSNVLDIRRVAPAGHPPGTRVHKHTEWCLHQYRSRFPRPLAAREYQYARRVWHRPSDGGCYVLCRGLPLPDAGDGVRAVKVTDIYSGCVIRAAAAAPGGAPTSTEVVSVYFEDSGVRAGLAKMAVKGMWAYMQHYEAALRVFADARRAAEADHAAAGSAPAGARRRASLDGDAAPRRRAAPVHCVAEAGADAGADSDGGGSSSGDDTLHDTYAAMARRLRGPASRSQKARWAGRFALLAGIRVATVLLASGRR